MVFIATFWAAVVNLVLLVVALALHPASLDGLAWLRDLPWEWFGTEMAGMLDMQAVQAEALWALWLSTSGVLLLGAALAYGAVKVGARSAPAAPAVQPQVAAMFSDLSSGMEGLGGFGTAFPAALAPAADLPRQSHAAHDLGLADLAPSAPSPPAPDKGQDIAATLQQIDPQLGASYDALLQELKK